MQRYLTEPLTQPLKLEEESPLACSECGSTKIITDIYTGEEVCVRCGLVLSDNMVSRLRDKIAYTSNYDEGSSHGPYANQRAFDGGLNTFIQGVKDKRGIPLGSEAATDMRRLQKQNARSKMMDTATRNLCTAMIELDRLAYLLNIPASAKEYAAYTYRRALDADLIRGRSIDSFVAASVYAACRVLGIPRPLKLVVEKSMREQKEVSMIYRLMLRRLGIRPPRDDPCKYVPYLASQLGVSRDVETAAQRLLASVRRSPEITGKDPRGIAGAALFLASEEIGVSLVQCRVAEATGTTAVTLRSRCKGLKEALESRRN